MTDQPRNGFLLALPPAVYERLAESLKLVSLEHGHMLHRVGDEIEQVYFPIGCLLSLISTDGSGASVETSMVGNEGACGLLEVCGSTRISVDCVVQIDGQAWRAPAAHCRALALSEPEFAAAAWRLTELQMTESRQSGFCQAMHTVEGRFSRWLLESLDRSARRNPLPLTQEFIAAMLGVQRTTVSAFASQLQKERLITYSRGQIKVTDEEALERRACDCRTVVKNERARLNLRAQD